MTHCHCLASSVDMAHRNIPIFIPHMGCPNQCVFCNQRSISGCREFRIEDVTQQIEAALATISEGTETEIAFFGGSFTGIDRGLMLRLLDTAQTYVRAGRVDSIRLSTRPDYITPEILSILSRYSVKVIELGLQSMDDAVLRASGRGHTAETARRACRAVVDAGFSLVGQMMIGLPGSTPKNERATAREIVSLGASAARIYPTVVFYGTPLWEMTERGEYLPISLNQAVDRSADVLEIFLGARVKCIRIGLCANEDLVSSEEVAEGANHPALGEFVWNEYYYRRMYEALAKQGLLGKDVVISVPFADVSKAVGQHRSNVIRLLRNTETRVRKIVGDKTLNRVVPVQWQPQQNKKKEQNDSVSEITGNAGL